MYLKIKSKLYMFGLLILIIFCLISSSLIFNKSILQVFLKKLMINSINR